ncbi:MAG: Crp/Fnr family transcriptional regulator [Bdellovibrionales bacterium]|nr:Crp/Fnr family transcriptional regulator [Bdellovibrionales bacterium]
MDQAKVTNTYKRGQYIFYEGNVPSGLYCVNGGVVKLETSSESGNNHILRMAHTGDMLGYRSLFAEEPYRASALVHEDATICFVPKSAITKLVETYPQVALNFLSQVSKELRRAEDRFCGLTDKNAGERIAESLLFLHDNFNEQTWTRKEIAEWAGTTPETVIRTLADFEAKGIVDLQGRKILIKNKKALLELANLAL